MPTPKNVLVRSYDSMQELEDGANLLHIDGYYIILVVVQRIGGNIEYVVIYRHDAWSLENPTNVP